MIQAVLFDIDGVLVSTKPLHQMSFISALKQHGHNLSEKDHEQLDGLSTREKLSRLGIHDTENKIFLTKKEITFKNIDRFVNLDKNLIEIFNYLKTNNYKIGICSNAIKEFCNLIIEKLGIKDYIDVILSNEDVCFPKPNPEIYLKCMQLLNEIPNNCLILEDSKFGLSAAFSSGANVFYIENPNHLTLEKLKKYLEVYKC